MRFTKTKRSRGVTIPVAVVTAFALAALTGCSGDAGATDPSEGGDYDPIVITYADYLTETSTYGRMSLFFQENVTERTGGKVTFENYWGGSLLGAADQLSGVRDGVADMALIFGGIFPSELPISSWLLALGMDLTGSPLHDFVAGSAAAQELAHSYEPLLDEFAGHDLKPLYWTSTVPFMATCTDPLGDGSDAYSGRQTRASGVFQSGATEAVDGVPVTVAFNEIYEGLQRGVLDCALTDPGSIPAFSFEEVAPELLPLPIISALGGYTMNLEFWESLPAEVQNILYEEAAHAAIEYTHISNDDAGMLGDLVADGAMRINDVSDLMPALQAYQKDTLDGLPAQAPAGVENPQEIIDWWKERKAYWVDVLVEQGHPVVGVEPDEIGEFFDSAADIDVTDFWERYREETVLTSLPNR